MLKLEEYYQDVILLAEGGMSKVYLATDKKLGRRVAVKVISLTQHTQSDALNEARLLARFNHPNIVQIYDVFESDGQMALEMEYVQGATLQHYTKTHVLNTEQKVELLSHIADGLASAHGQNILHLDLKPGNILVNEQSIAKIADFGISQLEDNQASRPHTSYGSLTAMSPEQLRDETLDSRSDLFSFGIIAYQLLAGHHPYFEQADDGSDKSIAEQIKFQPLKASAKRILDIPPALAQLIDRLLQYDKNARPSSANEVSQQLKQILHAFSYDNSEATLSLEQIELRDRAREKAKARKKQLGIAALFTFLVCLAVGGYWYWQETKPKIYIAALPVEFSESTQILNAHKQIIELAIQDAIKQYFLDDSSHVLIANSEISQTQKLLGDTAPLKEIGAALNADILISSQLVCDVNSCDIELSTINGANATLTNSVRNVTSSESYGDVFNVTLSSLYSLSKEESAPELTDRNFLNQYAELYREAQSVNIENRTTIKKIESLIRISPDFLPLYSIYTKTAINAFKNSSDNLILHSLSEVLESAPEKLRNTPLYQTHLLQLYQYSQNNREAKKVLETIHSSSLDEFEKQGLLSFYLDLQGDYEAALIHTTNAFKLRPTLSITRNAAFLNIRLGRYEQALSYLEKAQQYAPNDFKTLKTIADIYSFLGKLDEASTAYKKLIENEKINTATLNNYSVVLMLKGELISALEYTSQAVEHAPSKAEFLINHADLLTLTNQQQKAEEVYLRVLTLDNSKVTKLVKAQALAHLGNFQEALLLVEQQIALEPNSAEAYYVKALIQTLLHETYSAISSLQRSLNLGWSAVFYRLAWFKPLCNQPDLAAQIGQLNYSYLCQKT
ncbi:serine/threonine protein kinase [Pseudoalteromonas sp. GCY]|uniref:serine/threonine-protein kinase n=1 Tax=Pseudoalteromonas sp. GCY TaxID=2003316 RepID=UPI000BFEF895|nr:serine/threonine-protein kinase [Pseudoalteromonas sp. GCY]PHI36071.1 serine/threonine protein kinase [Pseudoalteromonas sp. GCY]QQQ67066.1 protein kinase [Pseudoalteromonas sp. GCY]